MLVNYKEQAAILTYIRVIKDCVSYKHTYKAKLCLHMSEQQSLAAIFVIVYCRDHISL